MKERGKMTLEPSLFDLKRLVKRWGCSEKDILQYGIDGHLKIFIRVNPKYVKGGYSVTKNSNISVDVVEKLCQQQETQEIRQIDNDYKHLSMLNIDGELNNKNVGHDIVIRFVPSDEEKKFNYSTYMRRKVVTLDDVVIPKEEVCKFEESNSIMFENQNESQTQFLSLEEVGKLTNNSTSAILQLPIKVFIRGNTNKILVQKGKMNKKHSCWGSIYNVPFNQLPELKDYWCFEIRNEHEFDRCFEKEIIDLRKDKKAKIIAKNGHKEKCHVGYISTLLRDKELNYHNIKLTEGFEDIKTVDGFGTRVIWLEAPEKLQCDENIKYIFCMKVSKKDSFGLDDIFVLKDEVMLQRSSNNNLTQAKQKRMHALHALIREVYEQLEKKNSCFPAASYVWNHIYSNKDEDGYEIIQEMKSWSTVSPKIFWCNDTGDDRKPMSKSRFKDVITSINKEKKKIQKSCPAKSC